MMVGLSVGGVVRRQRGTIAVRELHPRVSALDGGTLASVTAPTSATLTDTTAPTGATLTDDTGTFPS